MKLGFQNLFLRNIVWAPSDESGAAPSEAPKSLDEIASLMLEPASPSKAEEKKPKNSGSSHGVSGGEAADDEDDNQNPRQHQVEGALTQDEEAGGEQDTEENDSEDDVLGDDIFSEDGGKQPQDDADEEGDGDGESDPADAKPLGDDVKLTVTVDGEEQEVTLGELKRRYAGEGAIEKRLQIATESRNSAVKDYERMQVLTTNALKKFGENLFRRMVQEPTEELRRSNPTEYLLRKDLFDKETAAIQTAHSELYGLMQQIDQHAEQVRQQVRTQAQKRLFEIMPVFKDKVKGPKVRDALIETAREIGYSDKDIEECTDPLMFKVMALAARELRRQKGMKATPVKEQVRTMKKQSNQKQAPTVQRQEAAALAKARKTGNLDDIAAAMVVTPRKQRRG